MEHSEKSAAKPQSKRLTILHFVDNCTIIERKLLKTILEFVVFGRVNRINPGIDIRRNLSKPRDKMLIKTACFLIFSDFHFEHSISNFYITNGFLSRYNVTDLPFIEAFVGLIFWSKVSDFCWLETLF